MGTPLQIYVEKDVEARDILVDLVAVSRVQSFASLGTHDTLASRILLFMVVTRFHL